MWGICLPGDTTFQQSASAAERGALSFRANGTLEMVKTHPFTMSLGKLRPTWEVVFL